jgi:hypothetical protein
LRALEKYGARHTNASVLLRQWRCARVLLALQGVIDIRDPISRAPYTAWTTPKAMHGGGIDQASTVGLPPPDARAICALSRTSPVCVFEPSHAWPLIARALGTQTPPAPLPSDYGPIHHLEEAAIEDTATLLMSKGTADVVEQLQTSLDLTPNEARILVGLALKHTENAVPSPLALRSAVISRLEKAFTEASDQKDLGAQARILKLMLQSAPQVLNPGNSNSIFAQFAQDWDESDEPRKDPLALDDGDADDWV